MNSEGDPTSPLGYMTEDEYQQMLLELNAAELVFRNPANLTDEELAAASRFAKKQEKLWA